MIEKSLLFILQHLFTDYSDGSTFFKRDPYFSIFYILVPKVGMQPSVEPLSI
jgi:hypothetical protein